MTVNTDNTVCSSTYVNLKGAMELDELATDAFGAGRSLTSKLRAIVKAYWSAEDKKQGSGEKRLNALIGHAHISHARGGSTDPAFMVTKQMLNRLQKDKDADTNRPIISVVQKRAKGKDLEYVISQKKREATKPRGTKPDEVNNHKSKEKVTLFPSNGQIIEDVVEKIIDTGRTEGSEAAVSLAARLQEAISSALEKVNDQVTGKKAA